ncbi:MAG: hypothetical protein HY736_21665 [Verrucomicrobia bacterium]|nr:hypothetical protein [Verrucomicrobiota bacterium]
MDFAPTLLSLAGAPIPAHFQGTAFLGAAAGAARRYVHEARESGPTHEFYVRMSLGSWLARFYSIPLGN